jgi:hypothetical protein
MDTIVIKNEYAEILSTFADDLQSIVDLAIQRYLIEKITSKISEFRKKNHTFQSRYGCDYSTFSRRISEDEEFVSYVEKNVNKLWEIDYAEWEFCHKGIEDWTEKLQTILLAQ